jgi:hypothetical protein
MGTAWDGKLADYSEYLEMSLGLMITQISQDPKTRRTT